MTRKTRVLLIEDDPVFRVGLRVIFEQSGVAELVGEAGEGEIALALCLQMQPDVVLLDLGLPGAMGAREIVTSLKERHPGIKILALTSHADGPSVQQLLQAGIDGYCVKGIEPEQLLQAILQVRSGHVWWDGRVAAYLRSGPEPERRDYQLTPRERQVLGLLANGLSNQQIGRQLFISVGTVQVHVHTILRKLGARDRTQAAILALQEGLMDR
ncbi:response regulator [Gloeobacter violaceus]|uniref:Two-component response regulator n=1 Tax=Gloeobacter violaceus (strain ATCC 29082 / PCC 7421) TaxID=251221 RepID=Q7NNN2_GLOVI|nr:response regulator transcription factor [Gloeobacter violaceus]BAC88320.1 two-component response regulator [Gloeobacter violaceus PCC 7421]